MSDYDDDDYTDDEIDYLKSAQNSILGNIDNSVSNERASFQDAEFCNAMAKKVSEYYNLPITDLSVYTTEYAIGTYINPLVKNELVKVLPLPGYEFPIRGSMLGKHKTKLGNYYGIIFYKLNGIDYALGKYCTGTYDVYLYFVPKNNVFKFIKNIHKFKCPSDINNIEIPILEPGLLDNIVNNTIGFLSKKRIFQKFKIQARRGLMLTGTPGNGKSMLCKYIRFLCIKKGINYNIIKNEDILRALSKGKLNSLFDKEGVSFFDDIDISFLNRSQKGEVASSILTAMNGLETTAHSVKIFTTNEAINSFDEAFIRPGRIDVILEIRKPTREMRLEYMNKFWDVEFINSLTESQKEKILDNTDGMSFAQISLLYTNLVTKFVDDNSWDFDWAIEETDSNRSELNSNGRHKSRLGFS